MASDLGLIATKHGTRVLNTIWFSVQIWLFPIFVYLLCYTCKAHFLTKTAMHLKGKVKCVYARLHGKASFLPYDVLAGTRWTNNTLRTFLFKETTSSTIEVFKNSPRKNNFFLFMKTKEQLKYIARPIKQSIWENVPTFNCERLARSILFIATILLGVGEWFLNCSYSEDSGI